MAEVHKGAYQKAVVKVPEFLREPIEAAQTRLGSFEEEVQRLFKELQVVLERVRKEEWPDLKERLEKLRETGLERAQEWRGRAEHFRVEAMERLVDMQGKAMKFLGVASRDQVEELSREIDKIMKRLAKGRRRTRRARRPVAQA
jgi:polyhydroxyalkanoate synthesis regulator phasin